MNGTLLVVDDDKGQQAKIRGASIRAGIPEINVRIVDSAKAASELIYSGEQITMAVIDLMLIPDQETIRPALELIATLRKRLPDCAIIALTRNYSVSFGREAIRYGANDFVCTKWYDRDSWEDHLQKRIELWLPGAIPTISATA